MKYIKTNNESLWILVINEISKTQPIIKDLSISTDLIFEGANTDSPVIAVLGVFHKEGLGYVAIAFALDPEVDERSHLVMEVCPRLDDFSIVTPNEKDHIKKTCEI